MVGGWWTAGLGERERGCELWCRRGGYLASSLTVSLAARVCASVGWTLETPATGSPALRLSQRTVRRPAGIGQGLAWDWEALYICFVGIDLRCYAIEVLNPDSLDPLSGPVWGIRKIHRGGCELVQLG